jgi:competence protein ComGC
MNSQKAFSLLEVCISLMLITLLLIPMVDHVALQVEQTEKIKQEILNE